MVILDAPTSQPSPIRCLQSARTHSMLIGRVEVMSTPPENELDLEKLFLPAWAQEPASANLYAKYEGGEDRSERGRDDRRGPRRERRGPPGERRGGERPRRPEGGDRRGPGPSQGRQERGNRPGRERFG